MSIIVDSKEIEDLKLKIKPSLQNHSLSQIPQLQSANTCDYSILFGAIYNAKTYFIHSACSLISQTMKAYNSIPIDGNLRSENIKTTVMT